MNGKTIMDCKCYEFEGSCDLFEEATLAATWNE